MERLTKAIDGRVVFPTVLVGKEMTPDNPTMYALLHRLAAYEDTGLEPEEIKELCSDDVAEILNMIHKIIENGGINHLQEYLTAEEAEAAMKKMKEADNETD